MVCKTSADLKMLAYLWCSGVKSWKCQKKMFSDIWHVEYLNATFSYADQTITVWTAKCQCQVAVLAALSIQSDTGRIETCQHFPGGKLNDNPSPVGGYDWVFHKGIGLMSSWGRKNKLPQSWRWSKFLHVFCLKNLQLNEILRAAGSLAPWLAIFVSSPSWFSRGFNASKSRGLRICTCKAPHVEAVHVHKSHRSRTSQQPVQLGFLIL